MSVASIKAAQKKAAVAAALALANAGEQLDSGNAPADPTAQDVPAAQDKAGPPSPPITDLASALERIAVLEAANAELRSRLTAVRAQLAAATAKPAAKPPRPARVIPQDELDRVQAMAAAKAKAMAGPATGKSVKAEF